MGKGTHHEEINEKHFNDMEQNKQKREIMLTELRNMISKLEESMTNPADADICIDVVQLIKKVADHMLKNQRKTKKEVNAIMGGKILELHSEKMRRLGKREGKAEGRILGRTEGHREGIEEMTLSMLRNHEPLEKIARYSKLTMEKIRELGKVNGIL